MDPTISQLTEENEEKLAHGLWLLGADDFAKAQEVLSGIVPVFGVFDTQYSLYWLDLVRWFDGEWLGRTPDDEKLAVPLREALALCVSANEQATQELVRWFKDAEETTFGRIQDSESGLRLLKSSADPSNRDWYKQLIDAYKDKFELPIYLAFLANMVLIPQGEDFSPEPFKQHRLSVNGDRVHGRSMRKGLAVRWLLDHAEQPLKRVIERAYRTSYRNMSGHFDYRIDLDKQAFVGSDGRSSDFYCVLNALESLGSVQLAIQILSSVVFFETNGVGLDMKSIGFLDWYFNDQDGVLEVAQHFAHCDKDFSIDKVSFYSRDSFLRGPPSNSVMLTFNGVGTFPYDLRVFASNHTVSMLRSLSERESVVVRRTAVVPVVHPFDDLSLPMVEILPGKMFAIGGTQHEARVDQGSIMQTLDRLEANGVA